MGVKKLKLFLGLGVLAVLLQSSVVGYSQQATTPMPRSLNYRVIQHADAIGIEVYAPHVDLPISWHIPSTELSEFLTDPGYFILKSRPWLYSHPITGQDIVNSGTISASNPVQMQTELNTLFSYLLTATGLLSHKSGTMDPVIPLTRSSIEKTDQRGGPIVLIIFGIGLLLSAPDIAQAPSPMPSGYISEQDGQRIEGILGPLAEQFRESGNCIRCHTFGNDEPDYFFDPPAPSANGIFTTLFEPVSEGKACPINVLDLKPECREGLYEWLQTLQENK